MSKNEDAAKNGVGEAFDHWLWNHEVTTRDAIEDAAKAALGQWLITHEEAVTNAIAKQIVEHQGHRWVGIAEASQGQQEITTKGLCPACQQPAAYTRELDRYVHTDGSDNRPCWLALSRGEVSAPDRPATT
ncbi:hypothetical protein [Streptomyces griseus]|uniref:hypothetical protein n=1 Tax=Streptomyces griseus TaxID=1911 RepID=UPI00340A79DB